MNAHANIIGHEVIGQPGQQLTHQELNVLVRLADGVPTPIVAERLGIDANSMRYIEGSIVAKLGARNRLHMITRAFTLGVLIPQALCLLISIIAILDVNNDFTRPSRKSRERSLAEHSRSLRNLCSPASASPIRASANA